MLLRRDVPEATSGRNFGNIGKQRRLNQNYTYLLLLFLYFSKVSDRFHDRFPYLSQLHPLHL